MYTNLVGCDKLTNQMIQSVHFYSAQMDEELDKYLVNSDDDEQPIKKRKTVDEKKKQLKKSNEKDLSEIDWSDRIDFKNNLFPPYLFEYVLRYWKENQISGEITRSQFRTFNIE